MSHKRKANESEKAQDYTKGSKHGDRYTKNNSRENDGEYPPKAIEASVLDNTKLCKNKATCEAEMKTRRVSQEFA